uniref:Large ribosomal subunit protein uL13c n=1 Tax=Chondria sp. (in: red algae) TaxID=1982705 RepID=A0A1Z1MCY0_9FLOR|nr:ribosomal protein L13 [Chondria sp. (in: red algae)]
MIANLNKTLIPKKKYETQWYIIDARKKNLGRLSSQIAYLMIGKNNQSYLPFHISRIKIIIINSRYVEVTGKKYKQKVYVRHSGRPGGLKVEMFNKLQNRIPNRIIEHSIRGMLPKNNLGKALFKNIKIYSDNQHPHIAQQPTLLNIN